MCQKFIFSSGPASAFVSAVGAPHTDSQRLPASEMLIISALTTAKLRGGPEVDAEAESDHFDFYSSQGVYLDISIRRNPDIAMYSTQLLFFVFFPSVIDIN